MEIRELCPSDDRMAISRIYEESWKCAYRGIIPQDYLDSIPAGKWAAHFDSAGMNTLVVLEDGRPVGTASYCSSRFPEFPGLGEIVSIYFLPEAMGKGYGKRLLEAAVDKLANLGYQEVFLWVLEDNARARAFYEKAGFAFSGRFLEDEIGGKRLRELQYRRRIA